MKVTVCALTYKRPDGLSRLLTGLQALHFDGGIPDLRLVIVDNDPQGSARPICQSFAEQGPWPLKYVIESQRGIAHARNAALDNAGDAEWIAFIDDDEVPSPRWLQLLLNVQASQDADVVTGPVEPYFPDPPPHWLIAGRFLECPRYPTGQRLDHAYTNNVLFRAAIPAETGLRFDPRWALMGCEDLHFFQKVALDGYCIVWADEAVVREWIPRSRTSARWILQRAFRCGNSDSCVERELYPKANPRGHPLARAIKRLIVGTVMLPVGWIGGWHRVVYFLRHIWYGAGLIAGWFGWRYEEYRRVHGS